MKFYKAVFLYDLMIFGVNVERAEVKVTSLKMDEDLKVESFSYPFTEKEDIVERLLVSITRPDLVVITQTLCADRQLFSSSKEGTLYIIDITERLFGDKARYLGLSYHLYTPKEAKEQYLKVAGRNWVATCYLASSYLKLFEQGLLIDCGTNSTDTVPVVDSTPVTLDDNDRGYTRLRTGELLWSGLYFTHVPSISNTIVLDDEEFQIRATTKATSLDVYVVLNMITPEDISKTCRGWQIDAEKLPIVSVERMLDLIAADRELLTVNDAKKIAQFLAEKQREKTERTIKKILQATKKKYGIDMKIAAIAGAGKDIIVRKSLEYLDFEEIIDIEKAASEELGLKDSLRNCETSLGCALIGLQSRL